MQKVSLFLLATMALAIPIAVAAVPPQTADARETRRLVHEGISIELELEPLDGGAVLHEGEDARLRFRITDTATGEALPGLYPAAWMSLKADGEPSTPTLCKEKVEEFVGGSILAQAELDLNVYYVLALNHDASISVVDPLFGFGGSKLLTMLSLPGPGVDWALTPDEDRLFVTVPSADKVAVVETAGWRTPAPIEIGPEPTRVAVQPDAAYLWVTVADAVAVFDLDGPKLAARIPTGAGPHEIAFTDDSHWAFVVSGGDGTVSVIDVRRLVRTKVLETGKEPASIAYSPLADAVYVSHRGDGAIIAIDARRHEVLARIAAAPGVGQIGFAPPDGRLGFAVNPHTDEVYILDAAKAKIVQTGDMKDGPDQVAFSDELAFIRHLDSEIVLMLPLDEVGTEGDIVPVVDFPGGQHGFGAGARRSPAAAIVQAPGANAVLVANAADKVIYFYKEGMAAPMGGFHNYNRQPLAVQVVDRSLGERREPGVYETAAKMHGPGRYDIAFFLDAPRVVHCFEVEVKVNPVLEAKRLEELPVIVEPLFEPGAVAVGESVSLRFRLTDPRTGKPETGLRDVSVMTYTTANWQQRQWAREVDDGIYEVSFVPPRAGSYTVVLQCLSQHLPFYRALPVTLRATATASARKPDSKPRGNGEP